VGKDLAGAESRVTARPVPEPGTQRAKREMAEDEDEWTALIPCGRERLWKRMRVRRCGMRASVAEEMPKEGREGARLDL